MKGQVKEVKRVAWCGKGGTPSSVETVKDQVIVWPRGAAKFARDWARNHSAFAVAVETKDGDITYRDRKGNKIDGHAILHYLLTKKRGR